MYQHSTRPISFVHVPVLVFKFWYTVDTCIYTWKVIVGTIYGCMWRIEMWLDLWLMPGDSWLSMCFNPHHKVKYEGRIAKSVKRVTGWRYLAHTGIHDCPFTHTHMHATHTHTFSPSFCCTTCSVMDQRGWSPVPESTSMTWSPWRSTSAVTRTGRIRASMVRNSAFGALHVTNCVWSMNQ